MRTIIAALTALTLAMTARAGVISLVSEMELRPEGLRVTVTNRGDEAARDVQVRVDFLDETELGSLRPELAPDAVLREELPFDLSAAEVPGNYPAVLSIEYTDLNGHPFSALSVQLLAIGEALRTDVYPHLPRQHSLKGSSVLPVELANRGERPRRVELALLTSKDIRVDDREREVELGPWAREKVEFRLENFSALEGSVYPAFALVSYLEDGRRYSGLASVPVAIETPPAWTLRPVVAAAVVLVIAFVIFAVIYLKKQQPGPRRGEAPSAE